MMTHFARQVVSRVIWCLLATFAYASPGSGAEQLRILVVMPSGSAKLTRQVTQFEDALRHSQGPVVQARSLAEADAVVQLPRTAGGSTIKACPRTGGMGTTFS